MICLHFLIHLNSNKDVNILKVFSPGEEEIYWYVTGEGGQTQYIFEKPKNKKYTKFRTF